MDILKYLIIPLIAVSALACKHKPAPADNIKALQSADTALIMKTEEANPLKGKPITAKQLIIPGKSIGQTKVDESMETVFERFGRPDSSDAAMGSSLAVWYAGHDKAGYKTSIFCIIITMGIMRYFSMYVKYWSLRLISEPPKALAAAVRSVRLVSTIHLKKAMAIKKKVSLLMFTAMLQKGFPLRLMRT